MATQDAGQTQGQCTAQTRYGARCRSRALPDRDVCHFHAPERAESLRASRKAGGRATSLEVRALKQLREGESLALAEQRLLEVMSSLIDGSVEPQAASAMAAVARSLVLVRSEIRAQRAEARADAEGEAKLDYLRSFPPFRSAFDQDETDTVINTTSI